MSKIIQSLKWNVSKLRCFITESELSVGVMEYDGTKNYMLAMKRVRILVQENDKKLKIGTIEVKYGLTDLTPSVQNCEVLYELLISYSSWDASVISLVTHVRKFFRNSPDFQLHVYGGSLERIPVFENVNDCLLTSSHVDFFAADAFISKLNILDKVVISSCINGQFGNKSRIFEAKNVLLCNSDEHVSKFLLHFEGRHAIFYNALCNDAAVRAFIERWVSSEAFKNLATLEVHLAPGRHFNRHEILTNIEAAPWDPSKRKANYDFDPKIPDFDRETIECRDFQDVTRSKNGETQLASIGIHSYKFIFCVWQHKV